MQWVQAGLAAAVVGEQGAGHPLGPTGFAVLGAVGDVDDAEEIPPPGGLVDADEELAEEQVLVGRRPEDSFEDVLAEQPASARTVHQARSINLWRSVKARSRTSTGTPARWNSSSISSHSSWRSHGGQAASWSATDSGYG